MVIRMLLFIIAKQQWRQNEITWKPFKKEDEKEEEGQEKEVIKRTSGPQSK